MRAHGVNVVSARVTDRVISASSGPLTDVLNDPESDPGACTDCAPSRPSCHHRSRMFVDFERYVVESGRPIGYC